MKRSILGFLILVGILAASGAYAWFYYQGLQDSNVPHEELSVPERGHKLRQKTDKPMEQFEKQMGQRLEDRKSTGVDLSDNELNQDKGH